MKKTLLLTIVSLLVLQAGEKRRNLYPERPLCGCARL